MSSHNQTPAQGMSRATLDNGLRIVVIQNSLAPVVTTVMNYLVGSNESPQGFPGTAHALEHMMFRGSTALSADQLANIAAAMGEDFDGTTRQSVTQYVFTVPKQDLDEVLHIESLRMQNVLATDSLWDHERGAIEQEVAQNLSDPAYVSYTKLLSSMFQGTPYEHDAVGTRRSFEATTGAALKNFHQTWYAPNNAILVIVGDVDPGMTITEVKHLFDKIPRKKLPMRAQVQLQRIKAKILHLSTDQPYGLAVAAFRFPGSNDKDFAAARVLGDVLGSRRGSLYDLVPKGKALNAEFYLDSLPQASLGYVVATFPAGGNGSALLGQIRTILENIAKDGVPLDVVNAAKRHEVADAEFEKNSIPNLAMSWSNALAVEGRQSPIDDIIAIQNVTLEQVRNLARQLLKRDESISIILTPKASGQPTSSAPFIAVESFAATENRPVQLPGWAEKVNQLSIPASSVHPIVTTLSNGLRLIVQPETISKTISVFGYIRDDSDLENAQYHESVNQILHELLSYGTVSLSRVLFEKALDDIGATESAGTDFSLEVPASDFERGVALLAENELHPALPANAFKIIKRQLAESVAAELQSPAFLTQQALQSALSPTDGPDSREAISNSIASLSLTNIRNYFRRVFRPDLTTIVVVGNVTPARARAVIEHNFGTWRVYGPRPKTDPAPVSTNPPSNTQVPNDSRVQTDVTLAETLPVNRSNPDYYPLNLGSKVLGGAFYASRLSRDLRETTGLVYSFSSIIEAGPVGSSYIIRFGCDPRNVSAARAIVERDLKEMQTDVVPEQTLNQAKIMLLQQIPLSESSVESIAEGLISCTRNKLPLNEPIEAARRYVKLTPQQVRAAFAKLIRPQDFVQVTEGPSPK
jgi:zinc protease